jgi:hypothetical protein
MFNVRSSITRHPFEPIKLMSMKVYIARGVIKSLNVCKVELTWLKLVSKRYQSNAIGQYSGKTSSEEGTPNSASQLHQSQA